MIRLLSSVATGAHLARMFLDRRPLGLRPAKRRSASEAVLHKYNATEDLRAIDDYLADARALEELHAAKHRCWSSPTHPHSSRSWESAALMCCHACAVP